MNNEIYILSAAQISAQTPLCEDWMTNPISYSEEYVRAIEPNYKEYFSALEVRRYGRLLKRALLVSRKAMETSGVTNPDAIITGTGLGCIENTEFFLKDLTFSGEELLKPTHFITSTHNTISSLIAIDNKCHGYNSTYAHKGISFECALQDAFMQLRNRQIITALIGGHDEMTPTYFAMLKKTGYLDFSLQGFASETAVATILGTEKTENALCKIEQIETLYSMDVEAVTSVAGKFVKPDYILAGINGQSENDNHYFDICEKMFPNVPLLQYKNIFGESYTAPALGVYAAANCLQKGNIPPRMSIRGKEDDCKSPPEKILFYNNFEEKNHSFIFLSRC
jgi:3-oxoacyl-(acyl-carrier-protein) synthase